MYYYLCTKATNEGRKTGKSRKKKSFKDSVKARRIKHRMFTRGRGMLHPSVALGARAGLAGGGVSSPADKLDSGELIGVSVTEEISRQENDLMLWHQKREEGLCSMYASLVAFMCSDWEKMADRKWPEGDNIIQSCRAGEVQVIGFTAGCHNYCHFPWEDGECITFFIRAIRCVISLLVCRQAESFHTWGWGRITEALQKHTQIWSTSKIKSWLRSCVSGWFQLLESTLNLVCLQSTTTQLNISATS